MPGLTDAFDLYFSVLLAMAVSHSVAFSAFLFEDNYFITFYVFQNLAEYLNTEAFAFRFATVLYFTFTFFMCHGSINFNSCFDYLIKPD